MTQCFKGGHDFPVEDELGAYCELHGVTAIWKHPPSSASPAHPLTLQSSADEPPASRSRPSLAVGRDS